MQYSNRQKSSIGLRKGSELANSLQSLIIHVGAALQTEAHQALQPDQLPQAFAGDLLTADASQSNNKPSTVNGYVAV